MKKSIDHYLTEDYTFEENSENMDWSFLGLPTRSLIDNKGTAALELIATVRRHLSSGVMNPGIYWSAEGILSRTYKDKDRSKICFKI